MTESDNNLVSFDLPPFTPSKGKEDVPHSKHRCKPTEEDDTGPVSSDHLFNVMLGKCGAVGDAIGTSSIKHIDGATKFGDNVSFTEPDTYGRDMYKEEVFPNQLTLLDLSARKLTNMPRNVMSLNYLVYMYLANNKLYQLPDQFFDHFPLLQWLDLRHNSLTSLPGRDINRRCNLHCLLLEGNNIVKLPVELGYVCTLHGLNIRGNPLEMPPEYIVEQGVEKILKYLREKHQEQIQASKQSSEVVEETAMKHDDDEEEEEEEEEEEQEEEDAKAKCSGHQTTPIQQHQQQQQQLEEQLQHQQQQQQQHQQQSFHYSEPQEERNANMVQSPVLQRLKSQNFQKKQHVQRDMRKVLEYESNILSCEKNAKIEHILQKKKDEDSLKQFRQETKLKQELSAASENEIPNVTGDAPFGVYGEYMAMMSREEASKEPVLTQPLPKLVPLEIKKLISKEKSEKILELEQKIRSHYVKMHERRKKPKGTIAEEVAATKEYMDIARNLQIELEEQRRNLEYRFKAFTADI